MRYCQKLYQVSPARGQDCSDTEENALKMAQEHNNYIYVPPYNDVHVIAGQVTVGLEILEQSSRQAAMIDVAFVCIGGGGLISGVAAYLKAKRPGVKIVVFDLRRSLGPKALTLSSLVFKIEGNGSENSE
ncbi:Threonine dehydratase biosynthetic IlvA [Seminavis robusta]|uniref:Threonine dehydratase biosynthetic IlvA n=1 Tax=Seminavis robusta TaxID=568900 RepID=A0A9N8HCR2_9STRA|nr:Threonine dehydratase biosynthetic IlvA [Seminavis robusta]|eukprot:Sro424_g140010.1 Threonine dehydratase biosynthetic IlvA (130) ;mRNA; f:55613-56002